MLNQSDENPSHRHGSRAGAFAIVLTALVCLTALFYRTEIRSRFWAAQLIQANTPEDRTVPLTLLCNAGNEAWWGVSTLLDHPDDEVRQFGVLVLQHMQTSRAREKLLALLQDQNRTVREMAALGLALRGEDCVIPALSDMVEQGDCDAAESACVALERMGTHAAVDALCVLSRKKLPSDHMAAIIDALTGIGTPACAAGLLPLLADHRECAARDRSERILEELGPIIQAHGLPLAPNSTTTSAPTAGTIAERAAEGLGRISGLRPPFQSMLSEQERSAAIRIWSEWITQAQTP